MIRYVVVIRGLRPPFKWHVERRVTGKNVAKGITGEADTVEQAVALARDAALDLETQRLNAITEQEVALFEVEEDGTFVSGEPVEVPDTLPEDFT